MKSTQIVAIVVVVIVIIAAIGIGWYVTQDDESEESSNEPVQITDAVGNIVELSEVPERIVSTTVTATEMLCNLGFRSAIVGATSDAGVYDVASDVIGIDYDLDYPATIEQDMEDGTIANIGTWSSWSVETVAACDPDLVVMDENQISTDSSRMEQLQSLGIDVIVVFYESGVETIVKNYTLLGDALGAQEEAAELCSQIQAVSDAILDAVGTVDGELSVAYICYCYGYYYIYDSSPVLDVLESLGCTNPLPTTSSYTVITPEDIAAADPDIIIFDDMATELDWVEVIADWKADPVMGSISAIANDQIYCMEYGPFKALSYDTVHFVEGIALVATVIFHDELGVDLPNILTDEDWRTYIQWVEEYV